MECLQSEARLRLIMENAADLIAMIDRDGERQYSSPSFERLLGYTAEEMRRFGPYDLVHPEDRERLIAAARRTIETGIGGVLEYRMRHKDGSWRVLESHEAPFRNAAGIIEGVLIVARDITERKETEHQRQAMEIQLRNAQKLESIGQLAAGIAHEINTPTQFIGDNIRFLREAFDDLQQIYTLQDELLRAGREGGISEALIARIESAKVAADLDYLLAEVPKALDQSLEGVERVARIVRAMKEFAHPGTEEKLLVDINKAIETTVTVCRNEWKYVAELDLQLNPALPRVPALPGEFNQVILNLIINAAHAIAEAVGERSERKGSITIKTRRAGDWVEIEVADTGAGIPEKIRNRIFDPFFTTKPVGKGTGQGLAIARSVIVDKHGGHLSFESEPGKGTTFLIRLPISPVGQTQERAGQ